MCGQMPSVLKYGSTRTLSVCLGHMDHYKVYGWCIDKTGKVPLNPIG